MYSLPTGRAALGGSSAGGTFPIFVQFEHHANPAEATLVEQNADHEPGLNCDSHQSLLFMAATF